MNITNDVLLLVLTPIVVVFLVAVYALQSAANKILRIDSGATARRIDAAAIQEITSSTMVSAPRHLTVLINPVSGARKANAIFNRLRGGLEAAGLVLNIIETESKHQAYQVAFKISQQDCDGIVCVGGDGTVHEVVNGLLSRSDATIARHIPIAVIPCGSNNELARTLGIHSPDQAAAMLIRGRTRPLDILAIKPTSSDTGLYERTLYSFQGIGWGMTSEMLSIAERLRRWVSPTPLSPLRLTLAAILTILTTLTLPRYSAKLSFLPLPAQSTHNSSFTPSFVPNSSHNTQDSNLNAILSNVESSSSLTQIQASNTGTCAVNTNQCAGCERPMKFNKGKRPSTDLKDWIIVDGKTDKLLFFTASNTPGKLAPHAHLSDGYMDISLITACSRIRLTRLLMRDERLTIEANESDLIPNTSSVPISSVPSTDLNGMHSLPHHGYHIRQYKTAQIRLDLDRSLPLIVDGELLEVPESIHPLSLNVEVLRSLCYIIC